MNLSPVKISRSSRPFFNLNLELEDKSIKRAVCFAPRKRQILLEAEQSNVGVKHTNTGTYEDGTIKIDQKSTTIKQEVLGFVPELKIEICDVEKLINEVPLNTIVNVRGVVKLEEKSSVPVQGSEVTVRRPISCFHFLYQRIFLVRRCY